MCVRTFIAPKSGSRIAVADFCGLLVTELVGSYPGHPCFDAALHFIA